MLFEGLQDVLEERILLVEDGRLDACVEANERRQVRVFEHRAIDDQHIVRHELPGGPELVLPHRV